MPRRILLAAMLSLLLISATTAHVFSREEPEFVLGFKALASLIPDMVGQPLENEHHNPVNGDGLQQTTTGLMVWRKADNWTAFTDGWWTWVNGPYGLQDRANEERFDWEIEAEATARLVASAEARKSVEDPQEAGVDGVSDPLFAPWLPSAASVVATATEQLPLAYATALPADVPPTASAEPSATPMPTATPEPSPTARPSNTPRPSPTPVPTQTRVPTSTPAPTATSRPTATTAPTATLKPTATPAPLGVRSASPAGDWVTSTASSTKYYCSKESSYWRQWAEGNRIWFVTEADLLTVYPGRTKRD